MNSKLCNTNEIIGLATIYIILFTSAFYLRDSWFAVISAFCGITYTILAGKGNPACYFIGLVGSAFYIYLALTNKLWGNVLLYALYFVPMQIIGFFKWNKNLKKDKYEIVKIKLPLKENVFLFSITLTITLIFIGALIFCGDTNPVIDGITTIFSVLGMYLTVRRAIEQWYVWTGVNALSLIMWLIIAINGAKVYSTVFMWLVYFVLALYFCKTWRAELKHNT